MTTEFKDQQTKIYGYTVTLEFEHYRGPSGRDEVTSSCIINKGNESGSLCFIENNGCFSSDETVEVPQRVIDAIRSWAEQNGY